MSAINITKKSTVVTTTKIDTPLSSITVVGPLSEDNDVVKIVVEPLHPDIVVDIDDDVVSFKIEGTEQIKDFIDSLGEAIKTIRSFSKD